MPNKINGNEKKKSNFKFILIPIIMILVIIGLGIRIFINNEPDSKIDVEFIRLDISDEYYELLDGINLISHIEEFLLDYLNEIEVKVYEDSIVFSNESSLCVSDLLDSLIEYINSEIFLGDKDNHSLIKKYSNTELNVKNIVLAVLLTQYVEIESSHVFENDMNLLIDHLDKMYIEAEYYQDLLTIRSFLRQVDIDIKNEIINFVNEQILVDSNYRLKIFEYSETQILAIFEKVIEADFETIHDESEDIIDLIKELLIEDDNVQIKVINESAIFIYHRLSVGGFDSEPIITYINNFISDNYLLHYNLNGNLKKLLIFRENIIELEIVDVQIENQSLLTKLEYYLNNNDDTRNIRVYENEIIFMSRVRTGGFLAVTNNSISIYINNNYLYNLYYLLLATGDNRILMLLRTYIHINYDISSEQYDIINERIDKVLNLKPINGIYYRRLLRGYDDDIRNRMLSRVLKDEFSNIFGIYSNLRVFPSIFNCWSESNIYISVINIYDKNITTESQTHYMATEFTVYSTYQSDPSIHVGGDEARMRFFIRPINQEGQCLTVDKFASWVANPDVNLPVEDINNHKYNVFFLRLKIGGYNTIFRNVMNDKILFNIFHGITYRNLRTIHDYFEGRYVVYLVMTRPSGTGTRIFKNSMIYYMLGVERRVQLKNRRNGNDEGSMAMTLTDIPHNKNNAFITCH